jgi:hypothetical protein
MGGRSVTSATSAIVKTLDEPLTYQLRRAARGRAGQRLSVVVGTVIRRRLDPDLWLAPVRWGAMEYAIGTYRGLDRACAAIERVRLAEELIDRARRDGKEGRIFNQDSPNEEDC